MLGRDEVRVRRDLVAAGLRAFQARARQRGEAVGDVAAHARLRLGRGGREVGIGVQRRTFLIPRELDAEVVEVPGAVDSAVVVDPRGYALPPGPAVEEEQLLERHAHVDEAWKELGEPA